MQFQFSFKHMATSDALMSYAESKIMERVRKFVTKPIEAHVIFTVVRHDHRVQLVLSAGDGFDFEVVSTSDDMYASVDLLVDKLAQQLKRHKDKIKDHKGRQNIKYLIRKGQDGTVHEEEEAMDAEDIVKYEAAKQRAFGGGK